MASSFNINPLVFSRARLAYAAGLCHRLSGRAPNEQPNSEYESFIGYCKSIGAELSKAAKFVPPSKAVMKNQPFNGCGMINVSRTISAFCTYGKRVDQIVSRRRVKAERKANLAVLFDNSNSMTSWWVSDFLGEKVAGRQTPSVIAKIATIALCETFGSVDDEIDLVLFGSSVTRIRKRAETYKKLLECNGEGGSRQDLALQELKRTGWHNRGGLKFLVILTDGLPEIGLEEEEEDAAIQDDVVKLVSQFAASGVRIAYVPILLQKRLFTKRVGNFNALEFAEKFEKMNGVSVARINKLEDLPAGLFEATRKALTV